MEEEGWITPIQRCLSHLDGMGANPSHGTQHNPSVTCHPSPFPPPNKTREEPQKSHRNPGDRRGKSHDLCLEINREKAFWKFQEYRDEGSNPLWRLGNDPTSHWNPGIPAPHSDTPESNTKASQVARIPFFPPEFAHPLEVA